MVSSTRIISHGEMMVLFVVDW